MAAATRSSDPNLPEFGRLPEVGVTRTKIYHVNKYFPTFFGCYFGLLRSCFFQDSAISRHCLFTDPASDKSRFFDISEVGIRPRRCHVLHFPSPTSSLLSSISEHPPGPFLLPFRRNWRWLSHAHDGTLERSVMNRSVPFVLQVCKAPLVSTTDTRAELSAAAETVLRSCSPFLGGCGANE